MIQPRAAAGPAGSICGDLRLSVGLAAYPDHAGDGAGLVSAADRALYEAKRSGGNRLAVAGPGKGGTSGGGCMPVPLT